MGDYVYALSSGGVTATNLTSMNETVSIELPYSNPYDMVYYESSMETDSMEDEEECKDCEGAENSDDGGEGQAPEGTSSSGSGGSSPNPA